MTLGMGLSVMSLTAGFSNSVASMTGKYWCCNLHTSQQQQSKGGGYYTLRALLKRQTLNKLDDCIMQLGMKASVIFI